jgi:hypothetical protein
MRLRLLLSCAALGLLGCRSVTGPMSLSPVAHELLRGETEWIASQYEHNGEYPPLRKLTVQQEGDRIVIRGIFEGAPEPLGVIPGSPGATGWRAGFGLVGPDGSIGIETPPTVPPGILPVAVRSIGGVLTTAPATLELHGAVLEASFPASFLTFEPTVVSLSADAVTQGQNSFWGARVVSHGHQEVAAR